MHGRVIVKRKCPSSSHVFNQFIFCNYLICVQNDMN